MKFKKAIVGTLSVSLLSASLLSTTSAFADEEKATDVKTYATTSSKVVNTHAENNTINQQEIDKAIASILNEVGQTAPQVQVNENSMQELGVVSIGTKLIKKLGGSYVKSTLPKQIYAKFPAELTAKVSEAKWVGIWNTYILMGPLDEVHDVVTNALDPYVWHWVASTCGYIVQGVVYALI
ncbi:TPA: hypothetical protein QCV77_006351 [Bacillus thuringiensis]|nr:hypothetical protein [Bacillus thuringiensis]